ncbi:hypothetical protein F01_170061 [Burkholderia cenocepacia]|nr:hypothetical protein F01_170061 [Burkholderia cenocepacia]
MVRPRYAGRGVVPVPQVPFAVRSRHRARSAHQCAARHSRAAAHRRAVQQHGRRIASRATERRSPVQRGLERACRLQLQPRDLRCEPVAHDRRRSGEGHDDAQQRCDARVAQHRQLRDRLRDRQAVARGDAARRAGRLRYRIPPHLSQGHAAPGREDAVQLCRPGVRAAAAVEHGVRERQRPDRHAARCVRILPGHPPPDRQVDRVGRHPLHHVQPGRGARPAIYREHRSQRLEVVAARGRRLQVDRFVLAVRQLFAIAEAVVVDRADDGLHHRRRDAARGSDRVGSGRQARLGRRDDRHARAVQHRQEERAGVAVQRRDEADRLAHVGQGALARRRARRLRQARRTRERDRELRVHRREDDRGSAVRGQPAVERRASHRVVRGGLRLRHGGGRRRPAPRRGRALRRCAPRRFGEQLHAAVVRARRCVRDLRHADRQAEAVVPAQREEPVQPHVLPVEREPLFRRGRRRAPGVAADHAAVLTMQSPRGRDVGARLRRRFR